MAEPVVITLTAMEIMLAAICGARRHMESLLSRRADAHGADAENGWTLHIEGAAGEMAFARARGVYWLPTINGFKAPDVGRFQVRTRSRHEYDLLVRQDDSDDDMFALVTGKIPTFRVVGVILGRDAKRPEWIQTYGGREPAYFVPQSALRPVETVHAGRGAAEL